MAGPCDSPNEVTQKSLPSVLPDIESRAKPWKNVGKV
jgi:hypothetical protein